jgi:hypothetical protein
MQNDACYAYAKIDMNFLFIEELVKVIINIIGYIVSFDNLGKNGSLRNKSNAKDKVPDKAEV